MSLFRRIFGKRSEERSVEKEDIVNQSSAPSLCEWLMSSMKNGMSAEEISRHVDNCPICRKAMKERIPPRTPTQTKVNPEDFPTMVIIGIEGPFHLDQVLFTARREDREVIVMGNNSPAFVDDDLMFIEAPKFRRDPNLVLIFEKYPSRLNPFCLDPLVMVRRSFLLEAARGLQVQTLGELAIRLTMIASQRNLTVSFV